MTKDTDFSDMKLGTILKDWLTQQSWEGEFGVDENRNRAEIAAKSLINDQPHRVFLRTDEDTEFFSVFLYSPFNVPPARMGEMSRALNRINMSLNVGRLACYDDEDLNPIQFRHTIDVEGSHLGSVQITNMMEAGASTMAYWGELLAAVAMTKQSLDSLWDNFLEQLKKKESDEEESGPSHL